MKIEVVQAWKVNGSTFISEEDAREYIERKEIEDKNLTDNIAAIQAAGEQSVIPIQLIRRGKYAEKYNEFSFLIKIEDEWREFCSGDNIPYLSQYSTMKALTPGEFMNGFSSCHYEIASSTWFGYFVKEAARMNSLAGDILSVEEFAGILSKVEIAPF